MREIKFRALYEGVWFYQTLDDIVTITLAGFRLGKHKTQFTGLKDKNGKEIYEGDICKDDDGSLHQVFSHPGYFSFAGGVMGCGDLEQSQIIIEVIGNIYENPELLQ